MPKRKVCPKCHKILGPHLQRFVSKLHTGLEYFPRFPYYLLLQNFSIIKILNTVDLIVI